MTVRVGSREAVASSPGRGVRRIRIRDLLSVAVGSAGVAIGFLAGRDGSPVWQAVRVVVIVAVTAAAVYPIRRASAWLCGLVAFFAGIAATATGAGVGLPHFGKVGWSAVTLAGLAAFGAGVVLLIAGAGMVVRRTRRWWRLLVAPALLAVVYVSLWAGVQAVAATNVPRTAVGSSTPADRGLAYRQVEFLTPDGLQLSGWYIPSTNRAAVALLHGAGSTRSDVLAHAVVVARRGYGVLLFDARGHGRSGGRAMDFGWYGDRDIAGAVSFLQSQADVDRRRIGVVGLSMGGEEAIGAAATNAGVRAVVAEGATNRVAADKAFLPDVYGFRGWIQQRVDALTTACTDRLTDTDPPITLRAAISAAAPRPVLLIAAGNTPDEAHAARYMQQGNANVEVWEVPNTGHTNALNTHPDEWEQRVITFLAGALTVATA
jgi:uncharacterized protein